MTKFEAYYNLCPIDNPKEFLGVAPDSVDGNVITTLNRNIIIIIKLSTQKQIKSWSVTEKLTSKVVYDKQSQRYVGVFANRALRCWDAACEDVNKCKKLKFKKPIAELVEADDHVYVLYTEGTCELLAHAIESRKEQTDENPTIVPNFNTGIFDVRYFKMVNGLEYLTYFERQQGGAAETQLVKLSLENGRSSHCSKFKLARIIQAEQAPQPMGFAVIESNHELILISIWNDNGVFMLNLNEANESEARFKYTARFSALKTDSEMAVVGVSQNTVAIYGANNGQEGATLLLYNTKFHVVKTKQFFKVYLKFSRLWSVGQYILLAMGQNLSVVTYSQTPDSLADLLGTQASNAFDRRINNELYEEEDIQDFIQLAAEQTLNFNQKNTKNEKVTPPVADIADDEHFADGKKMPYEDIKAFDEALCALSRLELSVAVVEVEQALEEFELVCMSNYNDKGFSTPELALIAQELEACGACEFEITEKLLTLLIKANLLKDIAVCLQRYSNISEKMLVKVLDYVLKLQQIYAPQQREIFPAISHILNLIISCSFNPATIAVELRQEIDYSSVVLLMAYLYDLLEHKADELLLPARPSPEGVINDDGIHFEMQIVSWFSTLLSSHFQKLALSKELDLKELLLKWCSLCDSYKDQMEDLQDIAEMLYKIVDKKALTKEISSKWYTIEEVRLW